MVYLEIVKSRSCVGDGIYYSEVKTGALYPFQGKKYILNVLNKEIKNVRNSEKGLNSFIIIPKSEKQGLNLEFSPPYSRLSFFHDFPIFPTEGVKYHTNYEKKTFLVKVEELVNYIISYKGE